MAVPVQSEFRRAFARFAARVHRRRALRQALTGAAAGFALGVFFALAAWALGRGEWRPFAAGFGLLGAAAGVLIASRRRWSDTDVALYLDARLGSAETLTTALTAPGADQPALRHVVTRAGSLLDAADPARVRPKLWSRLHLSVPSSLCAIALINGLPLPPKAPSAPREPGTEHVKIDHLDGLERIEAIAGLPAQNPEQEQRLKQLAEQARKLRENLAKGLEKREALSDIAKLRDGIAAERLKLGSRQNRPGLDAALQAFSNKKGLQSAARALSNGDLTLFDAEMQKLASRAESSDRQEAKQALEEAAKAARERGAKALADALDGEKERFERRQASADLLREFAEELKGKLSADARKDLEEFGGTGNPEAERRLEEALERALSGLRPEERERLAQRMQRQLEASGGDTAPLTKRQLQELVDKLRSKDGLRALQEQLREMAKPEPSDAAKREDGLGDAERGGADAERRLGGIPIPMEGAESPGSAGHAGPREKSADSDRAPGSGSEHDTGTSDHHGSTPEVAGKELRSKAEARLNPGAPMHGATLGRAPARAGETANQLGTGTLGEARSAEVGAVDHADIPEEYREQVGRYFEP